jgi:hypothetical protein
MTRQDSQPSLIERCAVLAAVKTASRRHGGGQRPVLTATPPIALKDAGRGEEGAL